METITRGGLELTPIDLSETVSIAVRAPSLHVRWRTLDETPALETAEAAGGGGWDEAIAASDLAPYAAVQAEPLALEIAAGPALAMPDSPDTYVEMRAMPPPDEGLLLMVETDGVVQWYLPTGAPLQTFAALEDTGGGAAVELRFQVPRSTLT